MRNFNDFLTGKQKDAKDVRLPLVKINNMEDKKALELLKKDKEKGLEFLFQKYYDPLCRFVFLHYPSRQAAEEIVSDFFVKLWKKRHSLLIQISVKAYFYRSIRNATLNYIRDHKNLKADMEDYKEILISTELSPQEQMEFREFQERMDEYTHGLPERRKIILELRLHAGFSNQQIADALNISPNTVKNQLGAAIKGLKDKLKI
ncbi:RNA polymerase sigma factor [Negadavirga shengliensis]|uniref:RNA polymerase sigma factor n=1 Tax=Negadavirga shengliensis TaxID=1389218 RepID=A0ABV9T7D9_9BACT